MAIDRIEDGLMQPSEPVSDQQHQETASSLDIPEQDWARVERILQEAFPANRRGRKRKHWRNILSGIIHQLSTGCRWSAVPTQYGDDSTIHRWFIRWSRSGVLKRVLEELGYPGGHVPLQDSASSNEPPKRTN